MEKLTDLLKTNWNMSGGKVLVFGGIMIIASR